MNEDEFLSDKVREMYQEFDDAYEVAIAKVMEEEHLDKDAAELNLIREQRAKNKKKLQSATSYEELMEQFQVGVMDHEGYIASDCCSSSINYVHIKRRLVDGVQVDMWAEEDVYDSYFCALPETVVGYRITIADYANNNQGFTFLISLDDVWTKEKIMHEFEDIVGQVKKRVGLGVFEMMYGELANVTWGSHSNEESEE